MTSRPSRAGGRYVRTVAFVAAAGLGGSAWAACSSGSQDDLALRGHELAREYGCISCHTSSGSKSVGPTWKALYGSEVELDDGSVIIADEQYLRESILQPSAKTVKRFEKGLMETVIKPNSIPEDELRALIAYIKSLR